MLLRENRLLQKSGQYVRLTLMAVLLLKVKERYAVTLLDLEPFIEMK